MNKKVSRQNQRLFSKTETKKNRGFWFEYDQKNRPKGVKLRFEYDHIAPSGFGDADQVGIDSYVLFGSNTTYVWTGSPQMTLRGF